MRMRSYLALLAMALIESCSSPIAPPAVPGGFADASAVRRPEDHTSLLKMLKKQVVIGSTVDPISGDGNPYGLTVSPTTSGRVRRGDLLICNFNAKSNVQGTGESVVALSPAPGSKPRRVAHGKELKGCDALAIGSDLKLWASVMVANDNPVISTDGKVVQNLKGKPYNQPWGQIYAQPKGGGEAVYYESNAGNGSIVRIGATSFATTVIATGFPVNHGVPGTALAPSGLAYDSAVDTLYFADGMNDTLVAIKNVSKIGTKGIKASKNGMSFSGPDAADARIVKAGKPFNGPLSTALLPNGNIIVGNTLNPDGKNLMIEVTPSGKILDVRNVDKGAAGALFGIVATGSSDADTKIYFNDDNANNLQVLEK